MIPQRKYLASSNPTCSPKAAVAFRRLTSTAWLFWHTLTLAEMSGEQLHFKADSRFQRWEQTKSKRCYFEQLSVFRKISNLARCSSRIDLEEILRHLETLYAEIRRTLQE